MILAIGKSELTFSADIAFYLHRSQAPAALFDDPKMRSRLFDDAKLSQIVRKFCDTKELIVDQTSNKGNILVLKNHGYSLKPGT